MSVHIIIDGYNLIRQSPALSRVDREDIEAGRDMLLRDLAAYRRIKRHPITVVFDGGNAPPFSRDRDRVGGIEIRYSRRGELADTVIMRMAAREREKALVVSSDREVVAFAAARGCATLGSRDFEEKMQLAAHMELKGGEETKDAGRGRGSTRKKGPRRRLPKKKRRNLKRVAKL
jgi:uncharacterized protein